MILRHVVLMKLHASSPVERSERAERLAAALNSLPPHIEQIQSLTVGLNTLEHPGNWDLALTVDVADEEALQSYRIHPEHKKVLLLIEELVADRCAVDFAV